MDNTYTYNEEIFKEKMRWRSGMNFLNLKINQKGEIFLNITQNRDLQNGDYERKNIIIYIDEILDFKRRIDKLSELMTLKDKERAGLNTNFNVNNFLNNDKESLPF